MRSIEYRKYREQKKHTTPDFAYNTYLCTIPQDFARVPLHWHEEFELIYIKKGSGVVTVQLQRYPVVAGSIVVVRSGQLHAIEGEKDVRMEYENILFPLGLLAGKNNDICDTEYLRPLFLGAVALPILLSPSTPLHAQVAECMDHIDEVSAQGVEGAQLLIKGELYRLFYYLYGAARRGEGARVDQTEERLKIVLAFVEAHYTEKITVEQAAGVAGYSGSHFMHFFKKNMGQTFVEYLLEYRLAVAANLLAQTTMPVLPLSGEAGFENVSYFSRSFKARYGVTPGQYRRKVRG